MQSAIRKTSWLIMGALIAPLSLGADSSDAPKRPYKRITGGAVTLNPGAHSYSDLYSAEIASPEAHFLRYQDAHIRFVEVVYVPGMRGNMHSHPWPAVFVVDAPFPPELNVTALEEQTPAPGGGSSTGAPKGAQYPTCISVGPQAPHAQANQGSFPFHFYRIEFLRVDGRDFETRWREWYPQMTYPLSRPRAAVRPAGAPAFSAEWPYPMVYDAASAAPDNHRVLYETDHIRLVEVTIRPGETEPMHGHPYPSAVIYDMPGVKQALWGPSDKNSVSERQLDPRSPRNGQDATLAKSPSGTEFVPGCTTMGPQAPHQIHNGRPVPLHFYRIEYKRIDGDGLRTKWREWYPWMVVLKDANDRNPLPLNY